MSSYRLLEQAERLELLAASIYETLARRYAGDPSGADLFARLAAEEQQHAHRVKLLRASYRSDRLALGDGPVDGEALDELVEEAEAALAAVAAGGWDGDLEAALERAGELEGRFAAAHAHALAAGAPPGLARFFEQLASQDVAHRLLLGGRRAG